MTSEERQIKFEKWHAYCANKRFIIPVGMWFLLGTMGSMTLSVVDNPYAALVLKATVAPPIAYGIGLMMPLTMLVAVHGYFTYKP